MKKKIIEIIIGVGCLAGIVVLTILVSPKEVKLDLTSNIRIDYQGTSGEGVPSVSSNEVVYDGKDPEIEKALKELTYEIKPNKNLSNDDVIQIKVIVPQTLKDKPNVTITSSEKDYIVKGLKDVQIETKYKTYTEQNGDESRTISESYVIVDGVEIPSSWGFNKGELKRYADYMHCIDNLEYPVIEDPHNWAMPGENACEFHRDGEEKK